MGCKGGWLIERKKFLSSFTDNIEILGNQNFVTHRGGQAFAGNLVPITYLAQLTVPQRGIRSLDPRNALAQNFLEIL